jgi:CRISPR-associated protein Cmr1
MTTTRLSYTVRFLCPAFLGNAEQSGQWRTPPFKALLRQWWRVVYAADNAFKVDATVMRKAEGELFGAAADRESNRSRVRLRLDRWDAGSLKTWQSQASMSVRHPEVGHNGQRVGSDLYLGYGPLNYDKTKKATVLKAYAAIQAGETAVLRIGLASNVSKAESDRITKAISLMNLYATLGGRSRNGWGSFMLDAMDETPAPSSPNRSVQRSWRDALDRDWPHAIGTDQGRALIWRTNEVFPDWKVAMKRLAEIKIGLRTQFKFPGESPPHRQPLDRHWLSYPITKHGTTAWANNARLPNSLRFKLRSDAPNSTKVRGVIFHVPCFPPPEFNASRYRRDIESVWQQVHAFLDNPEQKLLRITD